MSDFDNFNPIFKLYFDCVDWTFGRRLFLCVSSGICMDVLYVRVYYSMLTESGAKIMLVPQRGNSKIIWNLVI